MTHSNSDEQGAHDDDTMHDATDRFVDSLLTHKFSESTQSMDVRIERAMRAIRTKPRRKRVWQLWAVPLAALLALSLLILPTTSSASAVVRSAAQVAGKQVDRQYLVILTPKARREGHQPPLILATLDVRDSQHLRFAITFPDGRTEIRGRDGDVSWEQRPDGSATISDGKTPWPRWVETPDGSLLIDSMSEMLRDLDESYHIAQVTELESCNSVDLVQIRARRNDLAVASDDARRNLAERIEMCIDRKTNEVMRLEMFFPTGGGAGPDGQRGPPADGARRGVGPDGQRDGRRPREQRGPMGPPQSISLQRTDTTAFAADWFKAPANAKLVTTPQDGR